MLLSPYEKYYQFCPKCQTKLKRKLIDKKLRFFCPDCDFIFWNNPKPVVSILLYQNNNIVLIKRASNPLKNYWCFPGGFINYDETPEEAIKREVKEEIGAEINIKKLIGVYQINNDPRGITLDIIFSGRITGKIKLSKEFQEFNFFKKDQLPTKIAYKHQQAIFDFWKIRNI